MTCWKADLQLKVPYEIAYKTTESVESAFVLLESNNGFRGIGAANVSQEVVGTSVDQAVKDLEDLSSLCKGQWFPSLPAALDWLHGIAHNQLGAMIAMDLALHDLFCNAMGRSVAAYYGQHYQGLPTSITIGINNVRKTLNEAKQRVKEGFQHLKIKIGNHLEEDIEKLVKIRETLGDHIMVRVDPNQGYSFGELQEFLKRTEHVNLEMVEQPLHISEFDKVAKLPRKHSLRIAADESLCTPEDAMHLASLDKPPGIFNIKLMKCGGIKKALSIAQIAALKDIHLMWGCNDESIVSISAALQAAFSCRGTRYLDLDGSFDLAGDIVTGGFHLENGKLYLTNEPGLGVKLIR